MRGLATLSSTSATPCGRSVTDSSRFILIRPQLLTGQDQPQLPSPALSLACNPDQTSARRPQSAGTDRRPPPGSQNVWTRSQAEPAASNHRTRVISCECPLRSQGQTNRNCHHRHYLSHVIRIKLPRVDLNLPERIEDLHRDLKTSGQEVRQTRQLRTTAREQY